MRIGFADCRMAQASSLTGEAPHLTRWIQAEMHGEMTYMSRHADKRTNPALLVENTRTVISLAVNYAPVFRQNPDLPQIAKYAYGADYHVVVKEMLHRLLTFIRTRHPHTSGRVFTDSAPVLEHAWAARSGLGWTGKHSLTIHPRYGSYIFLGELLTDLEIEPDPPVADRCGVCSRCMEACPVKAIVAPRVIDARRCLSYLTIEYKGAFDPRVNLHRRLFGCDICQDVCPWNKKAVPHNIRAFEPNRAILEKTAAEWQQLSEAEFNLLTAHSPLQRAGYEAVRRNATAICTEFS
jgi:epoxyqueuosine reductase